MSTQPIGSFLGGMLPGTPQTNPMVWPANPVISNPSPSVTDYQGNTTSTTVNTGSGYTGNETSPYDTGSYSTAGTNTYVAPAPTYDPKVLDQYNQAINNTQAGIDRLPNQLSIGNQNIDYGYNDAYNTLNQQKATGERDYNNTKTQTGQDFVTAKNSIGSQAGNQLNSLQRLLGARGAGGSSTALQVVPQGVARNATLQRTGVGNTFARNNQQLDTNWNDYLQGYNTNVNKIGTQRDQSKNSLQAQIDQSKATLLQNLATLAGQKSQLLGGSSVSGAQPYIDQANTLLSQADSLAAQKPVYQSTQQAYAAPSLSSYTTNPNAPIQTQQTSATDALTPYLSLLMGRRNQNNLSAL